MKRPMKVEIIHVKFSKKKLRNNSRVVEWRIFSLFLLLFWVFHNEEARNGFGLMILDNEQRPN